MLLNLEQLGKSFGEKIVLENVTASVEREDRIGIVGQNGAGKTTLLKILTGENTDYTGEFHPPPPAPPRPLAFLQEGPDNCVQFPATPRNPHASILP